MDERSAAFLEVMAAIAIVGVVSFLVFLVSRQALRTSPGARPIYQPRWYELILAAVFVAAIAIIALLRLLPGSGEAWDEAGRATTFFVVMLIVGGGALIAFVLSLFWRLSHAQIPAVSAKSTQQETVAQPTLAQHRTPSALRLIGLLGFAVIFLVFNWAHLVPDDQFLLMKNLIYPAGLMVALVMLFDKASRAWDIKVPGESAREWLYANAMLGLYLIAYLNLSKTVDPTTYAAPFWDMLHVAGFLLVLWMLDRKTTRLRFLAVHLWFIALPILLSIWRWQMGVELPNDIAWWDTVWPFLILALVFFVLELIILISTDRGGGISTVKDVVFLVLFVILLISVRPEAVA